MAGALIHRSLPPPPAGPGIHPGSENAGRQEAHPPAFDQQVRPGQRAGAWIVPPSSGDGAACTGGRSVGCAPKGIARG